MSWLDKLLPSTIRTQGGEKKGVPEGVWVKCTSCEATLYRAELERCLQVCPKCGFHMRIRARERLDAFLDDGPREELGKNLQAIDFLKFKDSKKYKDRYARAQKDTGEQDALIATSGHLKGMPLVVAVFDFAFMGGSMGSVVGERFARAAQYALDHNVPLVCFSASGGARMQEGLASLLQMAKTSAMLAKLGEAGIPFVSVMTDPTTGGVSASLAMLGDVNLSEPNALIGFAGQRVIKQTVGETLPEGFQRAEFLLQHGMLDQIVDRRDMRDTIARILSILTKYSGEMVQALPDDSVPSEAGSPETAESAPQLGDSDAHTQ